MTGNTASITKGRLLSIILAALCLALGVFSIHQLRDAAALKSQTLVAAAKTALNDGDYETAARFAIAATHDRFSLTDSRLAEAEAVLSGAVTESRRLGAGITFPLPVTTMAWADDGKTVAVVLESPQPLEDIFQIWDVSRRKIVHEITQSTPNYIYSLAYSPALKRFVALGSGAFYLLDPVSGLSTRVPLPDDAKATALTAQGDYLAIESDGKLRIWDMRANRLSGNQSL